MCEITSQSNSENPSMKSWYVAASSSGSNAIIDIKKHGFRTTINSGKK